mmetsp:Transcript_3796/g.8219  ORF Transcript_3796/g.8219 Transcript_3796/m.8219 type:complete len:250 (-) Transcript_3796:433-1182(-)
MGRKSKRRGQAGFVDFDTALVTAHISVKPSAALSLGKCPSVVPPGCTHSKQSDIHTEARVLVEDDEGDAMLSAARILTGEECAAWIAWGESKGFQTEKHAQSDFIAHRDNGRLAVTSEEIAASIFERLAPWAPAEVRGRRASGCNPNIRLYKYAAGQRFGKHVDQSNWLSDGSLTEFTVLLYLNGSELTGGETLFYEDHGSKPLVSFPPDAGTVLLHAHGDRCLTHEGAMVTAGVKYLLRTDLAYDKVR